MSPGACLRLATWLVLVGLTSARADGTTVFSVISRDDAFLLTGSPDNPNMGGDYASHDLTSWCYGGAGTLVISSANNSYIDPSTGILVRKGEFQSVIKFDTAGATALFDSTYGAGNWVITQVSLDLTSNWGTAGGVPNNPIFGKISGGQFAIEWLADDSWVEGTGSPSNPTKDGVTYDSLDTLLAGERESLGVYEYVPPGSNVRLTYDLPLSENVLADILDGGQLSFRFYAADDEINYLFNSHSYGRENEPYLHITAVAVPEPGLAGLVVLSGLPFFGRRVRRAAFSLVEILVTLSVMLVLGAAAAGWVNQGVEGARSAECVSHLQQWGVALQLYIMDNDGFLPRRGQGVRPVTVIDRDEDWFNALPPYLEMAPYKDLCAKGLAPKPGQRSVFLCPSARVTNQNPHFISYGMNMYLSRWDQPQRSRLSELPKPASLAFLGDSPGGYASTLPSASEYSVMPRHSGGANIVFVDGHVQRFPGAYLGCGSGDKTQPDVRWKTEITKDTWEPK